MMVDGRDARLVRPFDLNGRLSPLTIDILYNGKKESK